MGELEKQMMKDHARRVRALADGKAKDATITRLSSDLAFAEGERDEERKRADENAVHAARLSSELAASRDREMALERERDEAVNWSDIVDRHGTDQFDDLAEAWLELDAIKRVTNAVTSTFSKWANEEMMGRFRKHQLSMFHMAYVEGCLAGVKAAEAEVKRLRADTIEECAKVAETFRHDNPFPTVYGAIAAAIRALATTGLQGGGE